jgi:transcriptional regulator of acetoin/glycerol metabolism
MTAQFSSSRREADPTLSVRRGRRGRDDSSAPVLFVILNGQDPLGGSSRVGLETATGVRIVRGRTPGLDRSDGEVTLQLADRHVSSSQSRLSRNGGSWTLDDQGSKNGTHLNGMLVTQPRDLWDGDLIQVGCTFLLFRDSLTGSRGAPDKAVASFDDPASCTLLPAWEAELARLDTVARGSVTVLLQGETGTGKELLAARVHRLSGRRGAFVAVNCAGLTETLVASELFGHRKGAFSGANSDSPGLVRTSDAGTLFLDEVGDMAPRAQAAILRVLQEHEVLPVGATHPVRVDLRVVAASHRDLRAAAAAGSFRADLLARISGFTLALPPLRERREDTGVLTGAILSRSGASQGTELAPEAVEALLTRAWPLNVRELDQALRSALDLAHGRPIQLQDLPVALGDSPSSAGKSRPISRSDEHLRAELVALLRTHQGNVSEVARAMGKARTQVHRWMKKLGLRGARYRS